MDTKEFGALVRDLRLSLKWSRLDHENDFTQKELAEEAGIPFTRLGKIERGETRPTADDLIRLADTFGLTRQERVEFFALANSVPVEEIYKCRPLGGRTDEKQPKQPTPTEEIQRIKSKLDQIRLPLFVTDPFSDIVLYNEIVERLYRIPREWGERPDEYGILPNVVFLMLSHHVRMRERMIDHHMWEETAISNMQFFRRASMEVRSTRYWKYIYEQFRTHKEIGRSFQRYWHEAAMHDYLDSNIGRNYWLRLPVDARLRSEFGDELSILYVSSTIEEITCYERLYVTIYLPQDKQTARYFESLARISSFGEGSPIRFRSYSKWTLSDKEALVPRSWRPKQR